MKWSIKYIVSALPCLFTACSGDWLDLDPSTSVTSDNAIQSLEDAKTTLNGILSQSHPSIVIMETTTVLCRLPWRRRTSSY